MRTKCCENPFISFSPLHHTPRTTHHTPRTTHRTPHTAYRTPLSLHAEVFHNISVAPANWN